MPLTLDEMAETKKTLSLDEMAKTRKVTTAPTLEEMAGEEFGAPIPFLKPLPPWMEVLLARKPADEAVNWESLLSLDERFEFRRGMVDWAEYDESGKRMVNAMYFAHQFDVPFETAYRQHELFTDLWLDIPDMPPAKAFDRIKQRFQNGRTQVKMMDLGYALLKETWRNPEAYEQNLANIQKLQGQLKGDWLQDLRGFGEKVAGATAEQLPIMFEALKEAPVKGTVGMIFGALIAAGAGAFVPAPEEVITVPGGALTGLKIGAGMGAADRIRQLEAGGMFLELMAMTDEYGNKIDPKIAVVASHAVGAINGGIELLEWQILLSTFGIGKGLFNKSIEKVTTRLLGQGTIEQIVGKYIVKYGVALGAETLQELEQETTNIVFGELAKELNNARKGTKFTPISAGDLKERYVEVTTESLRAFGLIVAPGTIISGAIETIAKKPEVVTKPIAPTEIETLAKELEESLNLTPERALEVASKKLAYDAQKAAEVVEKPPVPTVEAIIPEKPPTVPKEPTVVKPAPEKIAERPPEVGYIPEEEVGGELTDKKRKQISRQVRDEVQRHPIYESALTGIEEVSQMFLSGRYYVPAKLKTEVLDITGRPFKKGFRPALYRRFTFETGTLATSWAKAVQMAGMEAIDITEFVHLVEEGMRVAKVKKGINIVALERALKSGDLSLELLAEKADWLKQGLSAGEINTRIKAWAKGYGITAEDIAGEFIPTEKELAELRLTPAEAADILQKQKWYRAHIHILAAQKGLTKQKLSDIKMKYGGARKLVGARKAMPLEKLEAVYRAVRRARPKRIGYKQVIRPKTEKKIQSLKENLIKKTAMTEADFAEILQKEVHGKEPRYISAKSFITEAEGKDIIRRMLDEAEVIRVTEGYEKAIRENAEISKQVRILDEKIAEKSKRDPWSLESMRYYNQQAEVKTGAPFYAMYMDLLDTHLDNTKTRTATWKRLENTIGKKQFKAISRDKEAIQRVSNYIAAQSTLKEKPALPLDITDNEVKLATEIQTILKEYRLKARVAKFFNFYYYNQPIAEYDRYKREINKAVDVFESKGKEDLIEYLDTQEWGVVRSGYEPLEVLTQRIRPYTTGSTTVGKGHIKIRTDIEYHPQERNILQRLSSYMKQIDMLYNMSPKINAYVRLYDDNLAQFKNPTVVKENIEIFLRNLKRYNIQGGFFEKLLSRLYSQAMRVIIMPSPVLSFRNLFQNAAFEHDKSILIDTRNKPLSNKRVEYLETYVLQTRAMIEEYFMVAEKPFIGLRFLTSLIDKIKLYPHSDIANRHWSFWAKINQVDRALEKDVAGMMKEARFNDITELEQRKALGILAKDGKEAMARYISRVHVDDIHFLYERSQRSPAEMTPLGKVIGNLFLFPRAYGEKLAHAANKMLRGKTYQEQWRGLKILFGVIGGGMVVGVLFTKITGRKRNPYDPLNILSYQPGGLALGALASVSKVFVDIMLSLAGSKEAAYRLTSEIPKAADMFIPFYAYVLRGYEALADLKNVDRRELRKLLELIDKEYKVRGGAYKVERTALEKWQYFIAGAGVDQKEKKTKPARPIKRK